MEQLHSNLERDRVVGDFGAFALEWDEMLRKYFLNSCRETTKPVLEDCSASVLRKAFIGSAEDIN